MSLHLGNLSPRVSKNDLERVFRRFGRCSVRVKDTYGFVVYDYPASAEKAMKTLRGNRICGEAITLAWSKRQPQHDPRFGRGGKSYGPQRRNFPRGEMVDRRLDLNHRPRYEKQVGGEVRDNGFTDTVDGDEPTGGHQYDSRDFEIEARHSPSNDQHGIESDDKNDLEEDDRWEQEEVDYEDEKYTEDGMDFDRYEPVSIDDEKEIDELKGSSPLTDSISIRKSHEGKVDSPNIKSGSCNFCGEEAHEIDKCPLKQTSQRGSSSKAQIDLNDSIGEYANREDGVENQCQPRESTLEEEEIKGNQYENDDSQQAVEPSDDAVANPSTSSTRRTEDRPSSSNSLRLSSEEIYTVLKHYGLPHPNENENNLPVEIYFGSARSWPWEIIYYRRLRKGSISAENYSRRISQNKEFGIVDKYIRGSSGWAELDKDSDS